MNDIVLTACRPDPVGSYLKSLGILRLVSEQADESVRGRWSRAGVFVLSTRLSTEELKMFLLHDYRPTSLVAPWNSGSGFRVPGKSPDAEQALSRIENSTQPRLEPFREAISAARGIVNNAEDLGWRDPKDKEFWSKTGKPQILRLCRGLLPDEAVTWLDACVVLTDDERYSPLLGGSGGVFGRMELSVNYMKRLAEVFGLKTERRAPGAGESSSWLDAVLFDGRPSALIKEPAGQFYPGHTGLELVNPWDFVLTLEGALLFASAAARRFGSSSETRTATLPFMVGATASGYGTSAQDESGKGEFWAPIWRRPAGAAELSRMLAEGRADWRGRQAGDGLTFLKAASSLGVDRGIDSFHRHVFVERNGQSLLAVPAGSFEVREMPQASLLGAIDPWLDRVRRASKPPASVAGPLALTRTALFEAARGGNEIRRSLQDVLVALARLESAIGRSSRFRDDHALSPVSGLKASEWLPELDDGSAELRVAAALAAAHDEDGRCLRWLLQPVGPAKAGRIAWNESPAVVPGFGSGRTVDVLARALIRRAVEPCRDDSAAGSEDSGDRSRPAYTFQPVRARLADVVRMVAGDLDLNRLERLLAGLMLLDWRWMPNHKWPTPAVNPAPDAVDVGLSQLLPFFHGWTVTIRSGSPGRELEVPELRPEPSWPQALAAGRVEEVSRRAVLRLRMAHLHPVGRCALVDEHTNMGQRLAAALLVPLPSFEIARLLEPMTRSTDLEGDLNELSN